jgi:hypothetical protein
LSLKEAISPSMSQAKQAAPHRACDVSHILASGGIKLLMKILINPVGDLKACSAKNNCIILMISKTFQPCETGALYTCRTFGSQSSLIISSYYFIYQLILALVYFVKQ